MYQGNAKADLSMRSKGPRYTEEMHSLYKNGGKLQDQESSQRVESKLSFAKARSFNQKLKQSNRRMMQPETIIDEMQHSKEFENQEILVAGGSAS